ncbi:hypothetical protein DOTSEDRAFT_70819 [Dothistroma septosporum NZE10]|uniref:FAD dependent oxidoreductase domain-containing protein n=1 Tax=Dothistroma septosporum (strain NZE10 / CBS 128990) TaxID=675120 RepID=N1PRA5_DOTSN|nr:hypothetical protein DOTSEDRAFT_70819 [Dothistroma septosporum NZE10]
MPASQPNIAKHRKPCDLPSPNSTKSFWHREPSALLLGHRSTRSPPETADVVVVGSGITGASVAHHLLTTCDSGHKLDVVLLEAREACWGATGRNGGHCQPILFEHPHDSSIGHFELKNFETLQSLIDEKKIDCEFEVQPGVRGIFSRGHLDQAELAMHIVQNNAPELASRMKLVVDRDELTGLRLPTALGAIVTNVAARMWPYKFVSRILEDLVTSTKLQGTFNLQTLTPVTKLAPAAEEFDADRVLVTTNRGIIKAKKVVLATNAYTSHLLPGMSDLIVPCRGQMSALVPFPSISGEDRLKTSYGFLGDGLDDYLIQRPNERGAHLMFGGGRQHGPSMGTTNDNQLDEKTASYLRGRLVQVFNLSEGGGKTSWAEMDATHEWTGIMGYSRDERPWVGAVPQNFSPPLPSGSTYIAAGFTGHGMPNTWLCGRAAAIMVKEAFAGASEDEASAAASKETGLPEAYKISEKRIDAAMQLEGVEAKDWAEMERGERARRPSTSGFA